MVSKKLFFRCERKKILYGNAFLMRNRLRSVKQNSKLSQLNLYGKNFVTQFKKIRALSSRDFQVNEFKAFPVRWRVLVQIIFVIIEPKNHLAFCQKPSSATLPSIKFRYDLFSFFEIQSLRSPSLQQNCGPDLPNARPSRLSMSWKQNKPSSFLFFQLFLLQFPVYLTGRNYTCQTKRLK